MSFFKFMGQIKNFEAIQNSNQKECYCSDSNGFYITKREASIATSIIIVLLTISLVVGYLWGQRSTIEEFTNKVVNDSLADQVNYSMYSMYGENSTNEESEVSKDNNTMEEAPSNVIQDNNSKQTTEHIQSPNVLLKENQTLKEDTKQDIKHFATLIGFGSKSNAQEFVNKLEKKGYNVLLIPRKSKTSKNKTITWYQITTPKFDDKEKLEKVVNEIKKIERLNDVKFMTSKN